MALLHLCSLAPRVSTPVKQGKGSQMVIEQVKAEETSHHKEKMFPFKIEVIISVNILPGRM